MPGAKAFFERCSEVREFVEGMKSPIVVSHYDADGIASGALVSKALSLRGIKARNWVVRKLSPEEISKLEKEKEIIFADLGGGQIDAVERLAAGRKVAVIDHHQTRESSVLQANPHLFGLDGSAELSAAGCGYFVFRDPELVELGIVGAMGDMQNPLKGLNRVMLEEGVKAGRVSVSTDLALFGRVSRGLVWFLQYCSEPYLPGLTGKRANCALFLEELGIPLQDAERKWRRYYQLSHKEKVKVVSGLVALLHAKDADPQAIRSLVGEVYSFPHQAEGTELSDANEFSTVLNACGRHGKPEIGIGVCLGDSEAMKTAESLLTLHRKQLRAGVEFAAGAVEDFGAFYFLDGRGVIDDGLIGVVAGMLYGGAIKRTKPIIALALNEDGQVKVSARATKKLIENGLDLGAMLKEATAGIGVGGGHNIAAGAQVEPGKVNEFLLRAGEIVERQLTR